MFQEFPPILQILEDFSISKKCDLRPGTLGVTRQTRPKTFVRGRTQEAQDPEPKN